MPPRGQVHDLNERTFQQWYSSVPVITRSLLTMYLITGLLCTLRMYPLRHIYYASSEVFKLPVPEVWRLVTNFTVVDKFSINFLFQMVWLVKYGASYESSKFLGNIADATYMLLVGMSSIMLLDILLPFFFHSIFHGPSLVFMILYLWSKQNPTTPVSFFGVINFNAAYLPFALMALDVVQGASIKADIVGILAGHLYYFLSDVYPRASGRHLLLTPQWLGTFVHRFMARVGGAPPRGQVSSGTGTTNTAATTAHPNDGRFRAFSGAGRRLAD